MTTERPRRCSVTLVARRRDLASGLGRYASSLGRTLPAFGVSVCQRTPTNPLPRPLTRLLARAGRDADTLFDNYALAADIDHDSDVYHLTNEYHAPLLLTRRPRPTVVTVHGFLTYFLRHQRQLRPSGGVLGAALDRLVGLGLRRADAIVAVSRHVKRLLVQQLGIPAATIRVIPEGVDSEFFTPLPDRDQLRRRRGLEPERRWLLYVGSEQGRKNFPTLVRSFAELRASRPDLGLVKVGQPEVASERERGLALARDLGVLEHIRFMGHAGDADLRDYYNLADVFVFPSLSEGFGLPPLEAMACGTPVVCADSWSLPEVVGDAAEVCPPTGPALVDAVARVLDDPDYANELRERGRARARRFSWTAAARATAEVYLELCRGGLARCAASPA
jgi:glycosyltransferase involved in cell wall biosynthesis